MEAETVATRSLTDSRPTADGGAATAISAITEEFVSSTVKDQVKTVSDALDTKHKALQQQMHNLEAQIKEIQKTVDKVSARLADDVITRLTAPDGILTKQNEKLARQAETTTKIMDMVSNLAASVKKFTAATAHLTTPSPKHKKSRIQSPSSDSSDPDWNSDTSESPEQHE